jgi:hypothetical protein
MPFDLSTAKPVGAGFDLSTAAPVEPTPQNEGMPDARRKYSLGEAVFVEAPFSAPGDLAKQFISLKEAVEDPARTIGGLFDLAAGTLRETVPTPIRNFVDYLDSNPEAAARASAVAKTVGGEYAQNYGDWEAIKRSIAERPVSTISDLSLLLSGGAGAARLGAKATTKAPAVSSTLSDAASMLQTGARRTDPFSLIAPTAEIGGKMVGAGTNYLNRIANPKFAALVDAAEGRGQAIINALRNYDDYVAGGMPTAGVAATPAGSTRYAALQQEVANRQAMTTPYRERDIANKAARERALGPIAQDEAAMAAAQQARFNVSNPLYQAAEQGVADVSGVLTVVDDLIAKNPGNAELLREMREIRRGLIADKKTGALRTDAKEITSVIDGLKARLAKEDNKFIKGQLKEVRELLVDAVPGYRAAQEAFGQASKPINVMQVGQYLEGKLKPAIETEVGERAGAFSEAVKNAPGTIKRSTGQSRYTQLTQVLTPDQVKVVEGIRKDLAREAEFASQAKAGAAGGKTVPVAELTKSPGFFSKFVTLANTIVDKLQGKINEKVAMELAAEMLDPKLAADVLEKALARQAKGERLADPFVRAGKGASRMMRGETRLGLRSPLTLGGVQVSNALAAENQNNLRND